jgi:DNA-binding transcriptional MerR regulator
MTRVSTDLPASAAPSATHAAARLRSGTAARLAGVPVATLRVWERRYAVVAAPKTPTGQRQYAMSDVERLRLLRQLTERGHAIGTIAALSLEALQGLAADPAAPKLGSEPTGGHLRLRVVGRGAAHRLHAAGAPAPLSVHDDLDAALAAAVPEGGADRLLVHLPSLQPAAAQQALALAARWQVPSVVVLYAFGAEGVAESLRSAGATVRREPAGGRELLRLLSDAPAAARSPGTLDPAASRADGDWVAQPRRFSDEDLARVAELPSTVACECPRHVAELVMQLGGFERYSAECHSRSPEDEALHRELNALAAAARTRFEQALARIAAHEGMPLPASGLDS